MQTEIAQSRLVAVRLNAPGLVRPIGVVHRKRKALTGAARAFLELLNEA
jgi:DNA-binding transcriptional LysR family regulator